MSLGITLKLRRRNAAAMEDLEAFWITRMGYQNSTIQEARRKARQFERYGFSVAVFLSSPAAAEKCVTRAILNAKRDGCGLHSVRNMTKVANRVLKYAQFKDARFRDMQQWRLEKPPRPRKDRFTPSEVQALRDYTNPNPVIQRRRRAILSITEHTGLRRGEVGRLDLRDVVMRDRIWLKVTPGKGGDRREVPMPLEIHDHRLYEYRWYRGTKAGPLWEIGPGTMCQELTKVGWEVGFPVSYTRFRRTFARRLLDARVHPSVGMHALGHSSAKVFEGYAGSVTDQDLEIAYQASGMAGY